MENQLARKIKNQSPFKKADIIIYLLVALFTIAMFLSFVVFNKNQANGFYVSVSNDKIITYDFSSNKYQKYEKDGVSISVTEDGEFASFKVELANGQFNVIKVDKKNKSVSISDSNCPHGDCKAFSPITEKSNGKIIYCAVHDLRVVAITDDDYTPPTTDGGLR